MLRFGFLPVVYGTEPIIQKIDNCEKRYEIIWLIILITLKE